MGRDGGKILISILLVPVLLFGLSLFMIWLAGTSNAETVADAESVSAESTLAERGYIAYQTLPEQLLALADSGLFDDTLTDGVRSAEGEEEEDDSGYASVKEAVEDMEQQDFLNQSATWMAAGIKVGSRELSWDAKNGGFSDSSVISQIESLGFDGFSEQITEIEQIIKEKAQEQGEDYWKDYDGYRITCGGVEFLLEHFLVESYSFTLECSVNASACYAPEEYSALVKKVADGGEYFLSASVTGGKTDVLTFTKNHAICDESSQPPADKKTEYKRLILLFEDGKLTDYYMTTENNKNPDLDDADREMLQLCTGSAENAFSGKSAYSGMDAMGGTIRLFPAK